MNNILLLFQWFYIRNEISYEDFGASTYIAIMTLTKFAISKTTNLYNEYVKALSTGQVYFKAILNAQASLNPHKDGGVEDVLADLNMRIISQNTVSH